MPSIAYVQTILSQSQVNRQSFPHQSPVNAQSTPSKCQVKAQSTPSMKNYKKYLITKILLYPTPKTNSEPIHPIMSDTDSQTCFYNFANPAHLPSFNKPLENSPVQWEICPCTGYLCRRGNSIIVFVFRSNLCERKPIFELGKCRLFGSL